MMSNESFKRIYENNYRLAIKIAFDMIRDMELAEDICQEVFMKLYQRFDEPDEDLIRAWIVLNTRRKTIDYMRKSAASREVCSVEENLVRRESPYGMPDSCPAQMVYGEFRREIFEKLKEKNSLWHDLMVRIVILDENPEAVAKEYGISILHLRTTIHRARVWIRKEFGESYKNLKY